MKSLDELGDDAIRFDPSAYAIAQERAKSAPGDLTWDDLEQLRIVSPALEATAREARRLAILERVPSPPPAALETKALETAAIGDDWDARVAKHGKGLLTLRHFDAILMPILKDLAARHKDLRQRLAAAEQQIATMGKRLEALEQPRTRARSQARTAAVRGEPSDVQVVQ